MFLKFYDDKRKSYITNFKMMMMMITGDKIRNSMIIIMKKKCCFFTNWSKDIQREAKYIALDTNHFIIEESYSRCPSCNFFKKIYLRSVICRHVSRV